MPHTPWFSDLINILALIQHLTSLPAAQCCAHAARQLQPEGQVPKPPSAPGWWQPSSVPTHQGAEPGSLPIFFKTGKSSSPELWEAHTSWLPWYRQGTTPTASGLSAQVNGLSLLRYSYSQRRQERALRGKNSPLLRKHLLFHSQHTHLHPAHLPAACPPNQQHGRPAVP